MEGLKQTEFADIQYIHCQDLQVTSQHIHLFMKMDEIRTRLHRLPDLLELVVALGKLTHRQMASLPANLLFARKV